jgi:1,4-dihydroxy-2-naphthoate octaprenyltransferase
MDQRRSASPKFYKNAAIVFFALGAVLIIAAVARHDWVYGAFGGITLLNGLMTTLKIISLRETKP